MLIDKVFSELKEEVKGRREWQRKFMQYNMALMQRMIKR